MLLTCQELQGLYHNQPANNGIGGGNGVDDVACHTLHKYSSSAEQVTEGRHCSVLLMISPSLVHLASANVIGVHISQQASLLS